LPTFHGERFFYARKSPDDRRRYPGGRWPASPMKSSSGAKSLDNIVLHRDVYRGVPLPGGWRRIQNYSQTAVPVGALDIFPYRDDVQHDVPPKVTTHRIPFSIVGKSVIVVDDVLYTGRSIRAAMDGIIDLGRPQSHSIDRPDRPRSPRNCQSGRTTSGKMYPAAMTKQSPSNSKKQTASMKSRLSAHPREKPIKMECRRQNGT